MKLPRMLNRLRSIFMSFAGWVSRYRLWLVGLFALLVLLTLGPVAVMRIATNGERFAAGDTKNLPDYDVAIVFGAGVLLDGQPTPYLQRRLDSAIDLYRAGKVNVLLLSGDNSTAHHNEPIAMQRYVLAHGVEEGDTVLDYAGFNTYDSCYRAKAIFGVNEAILISQAYHLPRAIWTCSSLGVKSVGVAAKLAKDSNGRDYTTNYLLREIVSSDKAILQTIFKPKPTVLGAPEPIILP